MLALIAGAGALPAALAGACGARPLVASLDGFAPDGLSVDITFRLETLGSFLAELSARGVSEVCFAGAIRRPEIDPARIDAATLPLVPLLQKAMSAGDDGALRAAIAVFEQAGFSIRAAHDIAPDLLPPAGVLTPRRPDEAHHADAARGADLLGAMARADIGQACAVHRGQAIAIEGLFGTDWMLDSLRARPDSGGGLMFKAPKPGQDRRVDLPVIGPATAVAAARAGLDGIVIEAGGVIALDRAALIDTCARENLFLWVREPGE